jgi:hypothetical protein
MSEYGIRKAFGMDLDEDSLNDEDGFTFEVESRHRRPDDGLDPVALVGEMARLMDTITRIGGEVCRLRAEMDGLLEGNKALGERFERLREVIEEKGTLDMDDFELACEVMTMRPPVREEAPMPLPGKKIAH